jgi:8-oxo-dGTP pyrophosphatase MutT (NUDIX family)
MNRSESGWEILARRDSGSTPYLGQEIWTVHHKSDSPGVYHEFQIILGKDYVQVVGCTGDGQAVLIVEDHVANGIDLQVVAGGIKEGQTPNQAADDEFSSETGWIAGRFVYLGSHVPQTDRFVSCTLGNDGAKRCHMFLALDLSPTSQRLEVTEKIRTVLIPWGTAVSAARTGGIVPEIKLPIDDGGSRLILLLADGFLKG